MANVDAAAVADVGADVDEVVPAVVAFDAVVFVDFVFAVLVATAVDLVVAAVAEDAVAGDADVVAVDVDAAVVDDDDGNDVAAVTVAGFVGADGLAGAVVVIADGAAVVVVAVDVVSVVGGESAGYESVGEIAVEVAELVE